MQSNQPITTPFTGTPPKKIHFIWVGSQIPEKYLETVKKVAAWAKADGFEVHLWVQDEKDLISKKANPKFDIPSSLNLKVRTVKELLDRMKNDEFYKNHPGLYQKIRNYIEREAVGFKNLASVVDFLKYETIRQEGGYYFDVDTLFLTKKENLEKQYMEVIENINKLKKSVTHDPTNELFATKLRDKMLEKEAILKMLSEVEKIQDEFKERSDEVLPAGIRINGIIQYKLESKLPRRNRSRRFEEDDDDENYFYSISNASKIGNDVIAATINHPVMEFALLIAAQKFEENDRMLVDPDNLGHSGLGTHPKAGVGVIKDKEDLSATGEVSKKNTLITQTDLKRWPYGSANPLMSERADITINTTGPDTLLDAIQVFWKKHLALVIPELAQQEKLIKSMEGGTPIMNNMFHSGKLQQLEIISCSDQNWLIKGNGNETDKQMRSRVKKEMWQEKTRQGSFDTKELPWEKSSHRSFFRGSVGDTKIKGDEKTSDTKKSHSKVRSKKNSP